MVTAQVTLRHAAGLHARPAALFVKTASAFRSAITVTLGDKSVSAKSIVQVLTLGARQGSTIALAAEGEDAREAIAALQRLVERNFEDA